MKIKIRQSPASSGEVSRQQFSPTSPEEISFPGPNLIAGKQYEVIAAEFFTNAPHAIFWVLGENFEERKNDGLIYPDSVVATDCDVVESSLPADWHLAINHYQPAQTRTFVGPSVLCKKAFLEQLVDGNVFREHEFLKYLSSSEKFNVSK